MINPLVRNYPETVVLDSPVKPNWVCLHITGLGRQKIKKTLSVGEFGCNDVFMTSEYDVRFWLNIEVFYVIS